MARKIQYRAVSFEQVRPEALASALCGAQKLVVAIDVAKTKMMAGFGHEDGTVVRLVKWTSPNEIRAFVELVMETSRLLDVPVEALMEPTGTYGEPLRALLLAHGAQVFMLSPKRVHDAAEVFDGVPSMHDAKACVVIARLHKQGISQPFVERAPLRIRMRALVEQRELYAKPMQFYLGRLEALLARHWPEALQDLDVWRNKTPLALLARYPGPADMLEHAAEVIQNLHQLGHGNLRTTQAQRMLGCAQHSVGVAMDDEAKHLIRISASEALRMRTALDDIDRRIEEVAQQADATCNIAAAVGKVTSVVLVAHLGPLTDYASAAALEKACGLNLKIRSSGNYVGRLSVTKRGSAIVRHYLYLASLRLIKDDPHIAAWFRMRAGYRGGHKLVAVVAVMRKLIRALWHVARGNAFDSSKLIDRRALPALAPPGACAPPTSHGAPALQQLGTML
jgi:transposase